MRITRRQLRKIIYESMSNYDPSSHERNLHYLKMRRIFMSGSEYQAFKEWGIVNGHFAEEDLTASLAPGGLTVSLTQGR